MKLFRSSLFGGTSEIDTEPAPVWSITHEERVEEEYVPRETTLVEIDPLPPYDHDRLCPKCHFIVATTRFETGAHIGCSIPGASISASMLGWLNFGGETREPIRVYPEHFERTCPNCVHGWAEAVVEP